MIVRFELPVKSGELLKIDSEAAARERGLKVTGRTSAVFTVEGELAAFRELERAAAEIGRGEHAGPGHWTKSGGAIARKIREQIVTAEDMQRKLAELNAGGSGA